MFGKSSRCSVRIIVVPIIPQVLTGRVHMKGEINSVKYKHVMR